MLKRLIVCPMHKGQSDCLGFSGVRTFLVQSYPMLLMHEFVNAVLSVTFVCIMSVDQHRYNLIRLWLFNKVPKFEKK